MRNKQKHYFLHRNETNKRISRKAEKEVDELIGAKPSSNFETLVFHMRSAQNKYFRSSDSQWLKKSKIWESEVDKHLQDANNFKLDL